MSPTGIESGAALGKFSPVEVDVGEEEIADGDEHQIQGKRALGHVEVARDRVRDAGYEEVQGEDVGADHPLAVRGELTVAGGDEGGEGAEEPDRRHDGVGERHAATESMEAEVKGHGRGDGDADDVDAAHNAVTLEVSRPKAGGEEEWAEQHREEASSSVRKEQKAVSDEFFGVAVGVGDDRVFGKDENRDGGEGDGGPEGGLGEAFFASRWGRGHGGGRHQSDPFRGGSEWFWLWLRGCPRIVWFLGLDQRFLWNIWVGDAPG